MARPTLPRIRRGRARDPAGEVAERAEARVAEISALGLTWVHLDRPTHREVEALAGRFGFHELDIEDVLSKRPSRYRSCSARCCGWTSRRCSDGTK